MQRGGHDCVRHKHEGFLPRELVSQWVSRALGSRETSAVGQEREDLSSLLVDLLNGLDGV